MAVFPDRIVFKSSTDSDAAIRAAVGSGGSDEIVPGEIVLGLSPDQARFYTKDSIGNIVILGSASNFTNPMTTTGDMLFTDASNQPARLPIGSADQILRVSGNGPEWYDALYISGLVEDTTPQLGGPLDVQSFYITSTSASDITLAPPGDQSVVVRGNLGDARIFLNSLGNEYSVGIKAPPSSSAANYTLTLPDGPGSAGQVLSTNGSGTTSWITAGGSVSTSSIGDLQDVTITSPAANEILQYDGTNWVNATATGVSLGSASIGDLGDVDLTGVANGDLLQYNSTSGNWEPVSPGGADISGADIGELANVDNSTNTLTAGDVLEYDGTNWVNVQERRYGFRTYTISRSAGAARNFDIPASMSGMFVSVTCTVDAWITFYVDGTARTADASRVFAQDPELSSGVLLDVYLTGNTELLITPTVSYFTTNTASTDMRVRARDQDGNTLADAFDLTVELFTN